LQASSQSLLNKDSAMNTPDKIWLESPKILRVIPEGHRKFYPDNIEYIKKPTKCQCSLRIKLVGDGCPVCNPALHLEIVTERMEEAEAKLEKIETWIEAYPLSVFPEPDLKKAAAVLKANGMTLDSISASNMRHVLNGVKKLIGEE